MMLKYSESAKRKVDQLEEVCQPYWEGLKDHPFIKGVIDGSISRQQFRRYFMQWGKVIGELILTIYPMTIARFQHILLKYPDLQRVVVEHMKEEFSHQDIEGVYMQTARALGIEYNDIISCNVIPEMQAYLNWVVKLSYQGTFAEIRASSFANEGCLSRVSTMLAPAIMANYGLTEREAAYYVEHGPADREHVKVNSYVVGRLIDLGLAEERPGYGILYCAETICKTNYLLLDGAYRLVKNG